jgi:hypothetical protein
MEGQAGAGDQPFGPLAGEAVQPRGLGDAEPDRGDAGRAWLAGVAGDGRVSGRDVQAAVVVLFPFLPALLSSVLLACGFLPGLGGAAVWGGDGDGTVEGVAESGVAELGEGSQGGVAADAVPGAGLALVPSVHVLAGTERFLSRPLLIPVKKKSSLAFRVHPGRY